MVNPIVRIRNLNCWYDEDGPPVLTDVNLECEQGEFVLILGPSGVGKTTLGLCLSGVIPHVNGAVEGTVEVDGLNIPRASVAEAALKVGMTFQDVESMLAMLYVRDEVAFGPENLLIPRDEVARRAAEALRFVNMAHLAERFVFELSGGQQQKVAIASILSMLPRVFFLDEPVANLDPKSAREVLELASRLTENHTVLLFDHRVDPVFHLIDRLVVMDKGTIVADGPPREVFRTHGRRLVEDLGLWVPQIPEMGIYLSSAGILPAGRIPLTVTEAADAFSGLSFNGTAATSADVRGSWHVPAARDADPVVQVRDVSYAYPGGVQAVSEVSFDIRRGELAAVVGPNGSGKTTLSKMMVGLLKPDSGHIVVEDMDTVRTRTTELVRKIGFVFQHPEHQFVRDTVREEVAFSLEVRGVPAEEIAEQVDRELGVFGLHGLEDRVPSSLSGGEKRRLSVATMLISEPDILVLDEPTYGQDRANTKRMMDALFRSAQEGRHLPTIILVTHDMKLVTEYADRVLVMRHGQLAYDGAVEELFERPDLETWANLEDPPIFKLMRSLRSRGHNVPSFLSVRGETTMPAIRTPKSFAQAVTTASRPAR